MLRKYHVVAIPIRIVFNRFGDHDPEGMMFVLKENEELVKQQVACNLFSPVDLVQPLIIRANVEDEVEICFENKLPFAASMNIQRAEYDVQSSDGASVGCNDNSTAPKCPPGGLQIYRWKILREGTHIFTDLGNTLSSELGSNVHGLFGALIAESKGSWWTDPITGFPINSGVYADIHHPLLPHFREFAWVFHDENEIKNLIGQTPIDPATLQPDMSHFVNYRSEPMRNRLMLIQQGIVCSDCEGEEVHHDSWVFGDPSTPILRSYLNDPLKIRLIHAGVQETHVFHYHVHQWLFEPDDPDSEIIDAQAISPQTSYTVTPLYGAGSLHGAFGDIIIHCHLYPHFGEGMWGMQRIFNTLQDGSQCYPNGIKIDPLKPLPDRPLPHRPTLERPGYPNFIPGIVGCKAPRPPLGIEGEGARETTQIERNQFAPNARPGAVFVNPCIPGVTPEREFHIVGIQRKICYNKEGWHDPEGRLYVLEEDKEDILSGKKAPEPLVIRANAGECVRIKFTNEFPEIIGGNAFQLLTRSYEESTHIHFVKFDPLVADGGNVGWNYDTSILAGQTINYQWYADVELKATFFHDHLFANTHQQHGIFASINVQTKGSKFLDPHTGKQIKSGTQAMITNPIIPDFREFTLFVHDFALLFDKHGCPLNPPPFSGSLEDPGVMGINYRNEPLQFRLSKPDCDPAYVFSSWVHGDPCTPLLETYNGDPVRIRLLDGAHEESHSFNLHRQRWHRERKNLDSEITQQQHIGISESFTLEFEVEGDGDFDMMYHYGSIDDLWVGNWGLLRTFKEKVKHLLPLPDRPKPQKRKNLLPITGGQKPPQAPNRSCKWPKNAPVRKYNIVALQTPIIYNKAGDNDPSGIVFALEEDASAILAGKSPEPLILRGNVGDCIEVTLHNKLDPRKFHNEDVHGYPGVPVDAFFPTSARISLHAQLLQYDVRESDGATIGFNMDQTVGPGDCRTYRWYVDQDYGSCNLWDMADLRNHRHHGAFGIFITEAKGSCYLDPVSRKEVSTGNQVIVSHPLLGEFREFVLLMHDGVRLFDSEGRLIIDPEPIFIERDGLADFEDQGSKAFNYRAERFSHRLKNNPDVSKVFSSRIHGDPATPIFYAYEGERTTIRFVCPSDRARTHTFALHGHTWLRNEALMNSTIISARGQNTVGTAADLNIIFGAGGLRGTPGDYMYRSGNIRFDIELGMWGIMRVLDELNLELAPLRDSEFIKMPSCEEESI